MVSKVVDYSALRKKLQKDGEVPEWFTTGGLQLFYQKYSHDNETVKSRYKSIARAMARHTPEVKPPWWESDEYTKGNTWEQVFFNVLWDSYISPSTPMLANGGIRKRGTTVACLTGDTPILTKEGGMTRIADIVVGDEVLTHKGRWRKVTHTQCKLNEDTLFKLKVNKRKTPLKITGNHPVLTDAGWVNVYDLDPSVHKVAANSSISIKEEDACIDLSLLEDFIVRPCIINKNLNRKVDVTPDIAWALGLWFAEGSLSRSGDEEFGYSLRVTMNVAEKDVVAKWCNIMSEAFGVKFKHGTSKTGDGRSWYNGCVYSRHLALFFGKSFGKRCTTKTISRWIMDLPVEGVSAFLNGFYDGDGRKSSEDSTPDIRVSNQKLMCQLYEMSLKVGKKVALRLDIPDDRDGNRHDTASLVFHGGGFCFKEKDIVGFSDTDGVNTFHNFTLEALGGTVPVYDITVEEDHSFSAAGVVVHNCAGGYVGNNLHDRYHAITEAAILTKHSHGTSYDIDDWPAEGDPLQRGGNSLGTPPLVRDFIGAMNEVTQGSRRGSLAYFMRPQHGDFDHILKKLFEEPESNNVGWKIDDEFISKLREGDERTENQLEEMLGVKLPKGKGYFMFIDKMNRHLAQAFKNKGMTVKATNLCTETCLPADEEYTFSCVILNYNLELWDRWPEHLVQIGQVMADCNVSEYLETIDEMTAVDKQGMRKIRKFTEEFRALGSGVLGLHTLFQMKSIVVGSMESFILNDKIFKYIDEESRTATEWLGKVCGVPVGCEGLGIRNATRLMMPPTKSTAEIMAGASEGIGLDVSMVFTKQSAGGEFFRINKVLLPIMKERGHYNDETIMRIAKNRSVSEEEWLSDHEKAVFRSAFEIPMESHLQLCSQRQKYIDQAQSINLYFTSNDTEEYMSKIHMEAFEDEDILSLYYIYSMRGAGDINRAECEMCQ